MKKDDLILTIESDEEENVLDTDEEDKDLNPEFNFKLDDEEEEIDVWNDELDKEKESNLKKAVDLDQIIKDKGGLQESEDEDELAMDGFGMGVEEEEEEEEEGKNNEEKDDNDRPVEDDMDEEQPDSESDDEEAINDFYESTETAETTTTNKTFESLNISRPLLKALHKLNFTKPTPIQSSTIPIALLGKDIVGGAQTGSGKTAAYLLPILERLIYKPSTSTKVIILTPTRELAIQVYEVGKKLGQFVNNLSFGLAVGGLNLRQQEQQLKSRPDIVIATPGRLIDHIRNSPSFSVEDIQVLVIDEADRMLEEGFQEELTEILQLIPKFKRQTLLFSATMNTKIQDLIQLSLQKPVRIMIDAPKTVATKLQQQFVRIRKREDLKPALLYQILKKLSSSGKIVVFVARKEAAHKLRIIMGLLGIKISELHGGLAQEQRLKNVSDFKSNKSNVLVCTDLAARGLDIKIEFVINHDMPKNFDIYLHRVGRTARAQREGTSISFVSDNSADRAIVKDAIKNGGKTLARNVDWNEIQKIQKTIESKQDLIDEVMLEEKQQKEILNAEMQLQKANNMLTHQDEILSKPKRTWFKSNNVDEKDKVLKQLTKKGKKVNSKKRKANEEKKERSYKKTKKDRSKKR
ncbi:unnamed protein product [Candida verbasci]|uniref:ATP-dependent RNA helicase DRS1 n=1 Tax=Candida verbasci TaxID=1227364 RepID=A0A9W4U0H2_9ASCO|nr:unnamed protein product [Candida verbasci]